MDSSLPFATVGDYQARGFSMDTWPAGVLAVRLETASRWLRASCPGVDYRILAGELDAALVIDVVCQMVARTAPIDLLPIGIESLQIGAGPYSETRKPTNPNGDFYLTRQERRALGCGSQRLGSVDLLAGSRAAYGVA